MPYLNTPSGMLKKKDSPSQEYKNLAPIAVFVGSGIWIEYLGNERSGNKAASAIPPALSPHLRGSCFTVIAPVLGLCSKQAS